MKPVKLIVVMLIGVIVVSCKNEGARDTISLYDQALKEIANNNYTESIDLLLKAKTTEDSLKSIDLLIGKSYFRLKQQDSALWYLNLALQKDSSDHSPYYHRGLIFFHREAYDSAISDFKSYVKSEPDAYMFQMIGRSYLALNKPQEAIDHFNQSIVLFGTDYYWYYTRAVAHYLNNDFISMKKDCDTAINLYDKDGSVFLLRAKAYYYMDKMDSACSDFSLAQELTKVDTAHVLRRLCEN